MRAHTLTQAAIGHDTLARKAGLVLGGSLFIALAAQVSVPFFPVPLTLSTLAVLLVGLTLGSRLGAAAVLAYLAEGAMGLPVFAGGMNGVALVGPTAGFLYGFVGMAWLAGLAVERGLARGIVSTAACGIAISALLYIPGLAWPAAVMGAGAAISGPTGWRPSSSATRSRPGSRRWSSGAAGPRFRRAADPAGLQRDRARPSGRGFFMRACVFTYSGMTSREVVPPLATITTPSPMAMTVADPMRSPGPTVSIRPRWRSRARARSGPWSVPRRLSGASGSAPVCVAAARAAAGVVVVGHGVLSPVRT